MGPWAVIQIATGSVCLAIGGIHVVVARRRADREVHLWFALAAGLAAANAFVEPVAMGAVTVADLNRAFKWSVLFQGLCWIALVWPRWYWRVCTSRLERNLIFPPGKPLLDWPATAAQRSRLPWWENMSN